MTLHTTGMKSESLTFPRVVIKVNGSQKTKMTRVSLMSPICCFQALTVAMAHVRRDGEWKELPARELVPGDLIALKGGDVIPADCQVT